MTDRPGLIVKLLRLQILWKSAIKLLQGCLNLYTSHWHIYLSRGKFCILPYVNSLQVTNSSCLTLHLVRGSSHPSPCLSHLCASARVIRFSLHRTELWGRCLSQPRWWVVPPGAIMDLVLIACWRTEACSALPDGDLPWEYSCLLAWLLW